MRSPGCSRIIQTRTRSLSETSSVPTHGLGLFFSRSNSAATSAGQADARTFGRLVQHRHGHGIPPRFGRIYSKLQSRRNGGVGFLPKTTNGRALVIGGSMSGLLAGLLLRRHGWDVDIFERVESELSGRGAGIVAQPELIETLRALGIDPTDLGVAIRTRKHPRCVGPARRRDRLSASSHRMGARLPRAR